VGTIFFLMGRGVRYSKTCLVLNIQELWIVGLLLLYGADDLVLRPLMLL